MSAGTYRPVIPTLRECQKSQLVLKFLDLVTHVSPKMKNSILSYPQTEASTCDLGRNSLLQNVLNLVL